MCDFCIDLRHLKGDANIPSVLVSDLVHVRVRIDQNGHLWQKEENEEESSVCVRSRVWCRQNVHTALQLLAMRLAVFLKVFSK